MVRSASLTRSATTRVTIYAALSRCIVVFTSIAAQSIIGSYDTSAELNNESSYMQVSSPLATNFDAEYFGKIAREVLKTVLNSPELKMSRDTYWNKCMRFGHFFLCWFERLI